MRKGLWLIILSILGCTSPSDIPPQFLKTGLSSSATKVADQRSQNEVKQMSSQLPDVLADFEENIETDVGEYRLAAGDEVTLEVWGYPQLSGQHIIGPDGQITLPLTGPFVLSGYSRKEAAAAIQKRYSDYYTDLRVAVRIDKYASNRVLVLGRVGKPGPVHFGMTPPTLLEAIALAGGVSQAEGLRGAESLPFTRCAIFRGRHQIVWIDLEPLLTGKNLELNIRLRRHDIVYIPELEEKLIYVLGQVNRPGAFRLTPNMSFLEVLSKAGGPSKEAAAGRINLIRPEENLNATVNLFDLLEGEKVNVALQEGDVLYVPTNALAKVNYALGFLNPFSTILGIYADIESIRANQRLQNLDNEKERLEEERDRLQEERDELQQAQEQSQVLE